MFISRVVVAFVALSILAWVPGAMAQNHSTGPVASQAQANPHAPAIVAEDKQLLEQMGAYVGSAQQFTFHANEATSLEIRSWPARNSFGRSEGESQSILWGVACSTPLSRGTKTHHHMGPAL